MEMCTRITPLLVALPDLELSQIWPGQRPIRQCMSVARDICPFHIRHLIQGLAHHQDIRSPQCFNSRHIHQCQFHLTTHRYLRRFK